MLSKSGKLIATAGQGPALLEIMLQAARSMQDVDGCLCYLIGTSPDEPDMVHVFEVWRSAEAHQASLELVSVRGLIAQARPILAGMHSQPDMIIHGGKGID